MSVGTPGHRYRHGVGSERILVTGSAGHLGEGVVRVLRAAGRDAVGLDILESPFTSIVGSVADREVVRRSLAGVTGVVHTATLHKPHIGSHERSDFVETNVSGTLALLEEAAAAGVASFVFTSTTSAFGRALYPGRVRPRPGSPRTSSRCRATSTASRRRRRKTSASSSLATPGCP